MVNKAPQGKLVNGFIVTNDLLGSGAFGSVYLGYFEKDPDRKVAVKQIPVANIPKKDSKQFTKLLKREIDIQKKLTNSKNIVTMHDCALTTNNLYMFLEYCDSGDLSQLLKKEGRLPEATAVKYFKGVCNAFRACYQNNIIHRDLKPANIMIHQGDAMVSDFGFARSIDETSKEEKNKYTMLGTPLYMAPQLLMEEPYSSKSDIWSLAMIFYEMLYGKTPFTGKTPYQLYQNIQNYSVEFPEEVPISDQVKQILLKMLEPNDDKRIGWKDLLEDPINQ